MVIRWIFLHRYIDIFQDVLDIDLVAWTNEHLKVARALASVATVLPKAVPNDFSVQG